MIARDFAVRTWGRAEGLPADSVTTILQTSDGYLWVGTDAGLARFDGFEFTIVNLPALNHSAPARITALCEGKAGELWVGTHQDGLVCFDESGMRYFRHGRGLLDDRVTSLAADAQGRLWIGTRAGLNFWDGNKFVSFTGRDGLADELVSGVHVARSGAVWITTRSGMYQFQDGQIVPYEFLTDSPGRSPEFLGAYEDRRGDVWAFGDTYLINLAEGKRFNYFRGSDAASVRIWSLCEGRDGRLWIGTSGRGLFSFSDNRFQPVTVSELHWPNDVRVLCEDREGNLWLGTSGGGLVQLLPRPVQILQAGQGLPPGTATSLATDATGRVFVGFETGGLLVGEAGRFEPFAVGRNEAGPGLITSLCVAPDQTLWIATLGSGLIGVRDGRTLNLTTFNGLSDNAVLALCDTPDGALWAGTRAGRLHRISNGTISTFTTRHGLPGSGITAMLAARAGGLWLGTDDGQFLRGLPRAISSNETPGNQLDTTSRGEADRFSVVGQVKSAAVHSILALHEDAKGRLWIGTAGAGLACWTGQRSLVWTTKSGLPDDAVHGILEDAEGELWLATAGGIYRVPQHELQEALGNAGRLRAHRRFEARHSSAKTVAGGWPRALRSPEGRLWFATSGGLVSLNTSGEHVEKPAPPVYLENILVNGESLQPETQRALAPLKMRAAEPVKLRPDLRSIEFRFTALNFASPEQLRFRHKLEGFEPDWVNTSERQVRYGRLPYGEYRFRVAASHAGGVWHEVSSPFIFQVLTPLWRTPEAMGLYVLVVVGAVAGIVRLVSHRRLRLHLARLEQQQALERERVRIAQDMHDDLGSKLTKISFLSERARVELSDNAKAAGQLESIASTSRELLQTLDEIVWAVNPHNDTLEHLAAYLAQYASDYFTNTAVECDLRLPRQLPDQPVSAEARHNLFLAFEEALNNALKHSGASKVRVEMVSSPTEFEIHVADDGCGLDISEKTEPAPGSPRSGNGLTNMQQRLADVGGHCQISSERGHGTTVHLKIPLNGDGATTER